MGFQPGLACYTTKNERPRAHARAQVWRVGLMGANATPANVQLVVDAFRNGLAAQGWDGAAKAKAS